CCASVSAVGFARSEYRRGSPLSSSRLTVRQFRPNSRANALIVQPCLCRACSSIQIAPDFIGPPALLLAALPPASHTGSRLITRQARSLPPGPALFVISSLHYSRSLTLSSASAAVSAIAAAVAL